MESYRTLRTRLLRLQATSGFRNVVLSSALAREGKTLTALNLGICCAQLHDMRVLVVDGDLRTRGLTQLLGYSTLPGLSEILAGQASFESAILETDWRNLYVLGAGSTSISPSELFAGDRWKEFIAWGSETFKLILIDAPPVLPLADFELISAVCDSVLVVVRALRTERELLKKASAHIDGKKLLGVVFNGSKLESRNAYYQAAGSTNGNQKK